MYSFAARSTFARQLRTSVSYTSACKQSGMPFFANVKQAAARPDTKVKRAAQRKTPFFSLEVDPEQLKAMRLYCRAGACH
jgi:hypothetical protein